MRNERNNSDRNNVNGQAPAAAPDEPLTRAAIVLLSMGEEPAAAVLRCLSRDQLLGVTQAMSRISGVKVDAVKVALQRFFDDYREQSGVHAASRSYLKRSLDLALGSNIANSVLNSIYGDAVRPKMARLQWASPSWLAEQIAREHVRMQAVFLAFLPPELATQVIDALPEESRDLVLLNVARLRDIDRELLAELEDLVGRCLDNLAMQSANVEGVKQAAEILNRLPSNRQQLVEMLRAHDPGVASQIEGSMYDFFLLARQPEAVLLHILDAVPLEQWAIALKGAEPAVRQALMQAMPRRQAQSFEDVMRRTGPVPISRVRQVRDEIMVQVRALAEAGEIEVRLFDEAVVE
ncbi:MAG TPA: FliG C-terminal domain-containing protein [Burkholderiaceae bacterium]|nr:FliG C-terminal domain-containing protein [Burkholderiaceae bacterium]